MRLQLLSDLHLESEAFDPEPAAGADALVLAGDIDSTWEGFERFSDWPVPVLLVAGNHEFDGREWNDAWPALRAHAHRCGMRLLERETCELSDRDGRRIRVLATTRWSDFDLYGDAQRERWDCVSCPANVIHGFTNVGLEPAYLQVMLGKARPDLMTYTDGDLQSRRDEHLRAAGSRG